MSNDRFPRSFRGYRRGDVEAELVRIGAEKTRLEGDLAAAGARTAAMQVEIRELHARVDATVAAEGAGEAVVAHAG